MYIGVYWYVHIYLKLQGIITAFFVVVIIQNPSSFFFMFKMKNFTSVCVEISTFFSFFSFVYLFILSRKIFVCNGVFFSYSSKIMLWTWMMILKNIYSCLSKQTLKYCFDVTSKETRARVE